MELHIDFSLNKNYDYSYKHFFISTPLNKLGTECLSFDWTRKGHRILKQVIVEKRKTPHESGVAISDEWYTLVIKDGKVSGEFFWPIGAGDKKKAEIVEHLEGDLGISLKDVAYIGDSDRDIEAFKIVGKSIAFNCNSEALKKVASVVVDSDNLLGVLPYLQN